MKQMFSKEMSTRELRALNLYPDFSALLAGSDVAVRKISESKTGKPIYAVEAGERTSDNKVLVSAAIHGEEEAAFFAAYLMARDLKEPSKDLEKILSKCSLTIIPCLDPDGFELRSKMFVDKEGRTELWPSRAEGRNWGDINGIWNALEHELPPGLDDVRDYITDLQPGVTFSLHETVLGGEASPNKDYGMLIIECEPEGTAGYGEKIVEHVKKCHFGIYKSIAFELLGKIIPMPEQTVKIGEGRVAPGPLLTELRKSVQVLSDYIAQNIGTPAYTFETFFAPPEYRAGSHIAGVEGGILAYLGIEVPEKEQDKTVEAEFTGDFFLAAMELAEKELGREFHTRVYRPNKGRIFRPVYFYAWNNDIEMEFTPKKKTLMSVNFYTKK